MFGGWSQNVTTMAWCSICAFCVVGVRELQEVTSLPSLLLISVLQILVQLATTPCSQLVARDLQLARAMRARVRRLLYVYYPTRRSGLTELLVLLATGNRR